jgi:hypothetical protein
VTDSPLIEEKQINAFAATTSLGQLHVTSSKEDSEQCSVKRHRFATFNDISDLVLGCFCNFVIKPPEKL